MLSFEEFMLTTAMTMRLNPTKQHFQPQSNLTCRPIVAHLSCNSWNESFWPKCDLKSSFLLIPNVLFNDHITWDLCSMFFNIRFPFPFDSSPFNVPPLWQIILCLYKTLFIIHLYIYKYKYKKKTKKNKKTKRKRKTLVNFRKRVIEENRINEIKIVKV